VKGRSRMCRNCTVLLWSGPSTVLQRKQQSAPASMDRGHYRVFLGLCPSMRDKSVTCRQQSRWEFLGSKTLLITASHSRQVKDLPHIEGHSPLRICSPGARSSAQTQINSALLNILVVNVCKRLYTKKVPLAGSREAHRWLSSSTRCLFSPGDWPTV
jgi:hypothetical protein